MTDYFPNLIKHINLQIQEDEWITQSNPCRDLTYQTFEY